MTQCDHVGRFFQYLALDMSENLTNGIQNLSKKVQN